MVFSIIFTGRVLLPEMQQSEERAWWCRRWWWWWWWSTMKDSPLFHPLMTPNPIERFLCLNLSLRLLTRATSKHSGEWWWDFKTIESQCFYGGKEITKLICLNICRVVNSSVHCYYGSTLDNDNLSVALWRCLRLALYVYPPASSSRFNIVRWVTNLSIWIEQEWCVVEIIWKLHFHINRRGRKTNWNWVVTSTTTKHKHTKIVLVMTEMMKRVCSIDWFKDIGPDMEGDNILVEMIEHKGEECDVHDTRSMKGTHGHAHSLCFFVRFYCLQQSHHSITSIVCNRGHSIDCFDHLPGE